MYVWQEILVSGLFAGIMLIIICLILNAAQITNFNIIQYSGTLLFISKSKILNFIVGLTTIMIFSAVLGFVYHWSFGIFWGYPNALNGLKLGFLNWILVGILGPIFDKINIGVKKNKIKKMSFFCRGYKISGFISLLIYNLTYGVSIGWFFDKIIY